jgi:hypothetical protein
MQRGFPACPTDLTQKAQAQLSFVVHQACWKPGACFGLFNVPLACEVHAAFYGTESCRHQGVWFHALELK